MIYKATLDNGAKAITIAVTILFAGIITSEFIYKNNAPPFVLYLTLGVLIAAYVLAFILRTISYEITPGEFIIHRLLSDVRIDRVSIQHVEIIPREQIGNAIRTFGVGGLFGYFGKFYSSKMGTMTWYATRRNNTVLIQTNTNKKIIVTPDEPEKLMAGLQNY